jgi:HAD superfamily hydrolase (TIGR01509 family)
MITTILSDLAYVLLFPKDKTYNGTLNGLYEELCEKYMVFDFYNYFIFNQDMLDLYISLKKNYSVNMLTSGHIQYAVEVRTKIDSIFEHIYSAEELCVKKNEKFAYEMVAIKLGKRPQEFLFIDDKQENLDASKSAGMSVIHFKDFQKLSQRIKRILR